MRGRCPVILPGNPPESTTSWYCDGFQCICATPSQETRTDIDTQRRQGGFMEQFRGAVFLALRLCESLQDTGHKRNRTVFGARQPYWYLLLSRTSWRKDSGAASCCWCAVCSARKLEKTRRAGAAEETTEVAWSRADIFEQFWKNNY